LVQSPAFQASVLPFILRGVNLLGIDSVELPLERKKAVWERLASDWNLPNLERVCTEIGFDQLEESLMKVLHGEATGRYLLNLQR
jgi:NADPH:quinone reductase-like Zn-dependent oxidoreductase